MNSVLQGLAVGIFSLGLGILLWQRVIHWVFVPLGILDPGRLSKPEYQIKAVKTVYVTAAAWLVIFGTLTFVLGAARPGTLWPFMAGSITIVPMLVIPGARRAFKRRRAVGQ